MYKNVTYLWEVAKKLNIINVYILTLEEFNW